MSMISTLFADQHRMPKPKTIENDELREITYNYNQIVALDVGRYPNVSKAISDFHQTKCITNRSSLKILAYFSIIECLLTHSPLPADRTDSITRQISAKMSLLSKRFQREIQYESFFPNITGIEKVWRKLYDYRSAIAHGENPDFTHNFRVLTSTDNIRPFLVESCKLIILYALKEPEFLADLQKC